MGRAGGKTAGEELELGKEDGKEKKRNRWN